MEKIKIKILKNFEGSTDGLTTKEYKVGEVLEVGSPKLSLHLYQWLNRNQGYSEIYQEKAILAPENKMLTPENLQNKSVHAEERRQEEVKQEIKKEEKSSFEEKITTKNNSFKKRK